MRVTHIEHSGFLVETGHVSLLFDYWKGEVPAVKADGPLYVFSSHRHEDHFNPEIFRLRGLPEKTTYLLSYDICRGKTLARRHPVSAKLQEAGRLFSLRMEEHYSFEDLEVWTMKSTDEGVAFLVYVPSDDKLIYHAGDLNWWLWDGDTKAEHNDMTARFTRQVERIRTLAKRPIDAAFLTLDPRQEAFEFYGMDYYREQLDLRVIFPMHCFGQYEINERYAAQHRELKTLYAGKKQDGEKKHMLAVIRQPGEVFEL